MADPVDLSGTIATEAALPASSSGDGQSASARPIGDVIRADQYVGNKAAQKKRRRGLSFTKLTPPGAMPDNGLSCGGGPTPFDGGPT